MPKQLLFLFVATISFIAIKASADYQPESKTVTIKADTNLIFVDAFSSLCTGPQGSVDISYLMDGNTLLGISLKKTQTPTTKESFLEIFGNRLTPVCSEEVKKMSVVVPMNCNYGHKRFVLSLDEKTTEPWHRTFALRAGQLTISTDSLVTAKVTQLRTNN